MTEYELLYIVPTSFTEDEAGTVEQLVAGMLAKVGATVVSTKRLGKLRMAYVIRHQTFGHYVLVRFQSETSSVAQLNELLRLSPDKVLRHIILRADEAGDEKYDLVQFQEVNVEDRADRAATRRREGAAPRAADAKSEDGEVIKVQVEKSTGADAAPLSAEDLQKKIDAALEEKA